MVRALGLCGFTGGFLMIAPKLRENLFDAGMGGVAFVQSHSPYSYVVLGVVALGGLTVTLASGSAPR